MLGRRLPKNRKFDYTPLYYNPDKEKKEHQTIRFKRNYHTAKMRAKQRSLIWLLVLAGFIFYLIILFSRWGR